MRFISKIYFRFKCGTRTTTGLSISFADPHAEEIGSAHDVQRYYQSKYIQCFNHFPRQCFNPAHCRRAAHQIKAVFQPRKYFKPVSKPLSPKLTPS